MNVTAEDTIQALEERVAFAEQARDNAIRQREDVLARVKQRTESAGRRIARLEALVRRLADGLIAGRKEVLDELTTILSDQTTRDGQAAQDMEPTYD